MNIRPPSILGTLRRTAISTALVALAFGSLQPAARAVPNTTSSPSRLSVSIYGANIPVDFMGSPAIPESRIAWLVQVADRSTCTTTPLTVNCDGFMSQGDRVVVGDNYMAFMDLTRETSGWGGGGGGLWRGLWLLVTDGTGNKNFRYISNAHNHAPNNLFPYQDIPAVQPSQSFGGDGHELLFVPVGGTDPENTYRASESAFVNVLSDGYYNFAPGWQHYHYHFQGEMTQGTGSSYTANAGTTARPSRVIYHLQYWFFNNSYASGNANTHQIQVRASIEACAGAANCFETRPIETVVSSLGFSNTFGMDSLRLDHFRPVSQDMRDGNYSMVNGVCANDRNLYPIGSVNPISGGNKFWATAIGTQPFAMKMKADPGDTLTKFRVNINRSTVGSTGVDLTNKVFHMMIFDAPLRDTVYDVKFGGMCGPVGALQPSHGLYSEYYLGINYTSP